jgi:hypothetical protein
MASSPLPISEAQLAANRANAKQSTGPRTAEAKTRTRLNGLRHGLTGQTVFLPDEDRAAYDRHHAAVLDSLKPKTVIESQLAHQIADSYWRLNRINAIENNIFALGIEAHAGEFRDDPEGDAALSQAQTYLEQSRQLNLLSLYEQRINRSILSLHKEFTRVRDNRRAAEARQAQAGREAENFALLKQQGLVTDYDAQPDGPGDGFAFSNRSGEPDFGNFSPFREGSA